ncbi:MAG: hypothetical protein HRT89_08895 [Lentisphaeria bacterium]|nr:hypothetical protein [Lentisphaeria bacterium]
MFKCDQLIYLQMQKTGCSHIAFLLSKLFDGQIIGKHTPAPQEDIESNTYIISSIRNPWDWYLSLWTFGVQGGGSFMKNLTERKPLDALKSAIRNPKKNGMAMFREFTKDVSSLNKVYDKSDSVESFRTWLKMVHHPDNRRSSGHYEKTAIIDFAGYMTFRYLRLCCQNVRQLNDPKLIANFSDLSEFENANCYVSFFIRQESLEDGICETVEKFRALTEEEKEFIYGAGKTNTSHRPLSISDYYDKETVELIGSRERLLIEKFDYPPPL